MISIDFNTPGSRASKALCPCRRPRPFSLIPGFTPLPRFVLFPSLFLTVPVLILLISASLLSAPETPPLPSQYVIRSWTMADGLPQNTVSCMIQSRDGYIWIGTGNGLARFDGIAFDVFSAHNTPAIRQNDVKDLFEDSRGRLWISYADDLVCLDNGAFFRIDADGGPGSVFENAPGELCLINPKGLYEFDGDGFRLLTEDISCLGRFTNSFRHPALGFLMLDPKGLHRWANGRLEFVAGPIPPPAEFAFLDGKKRLYYRDGPAIMIKEGDSVRKLPFPYEAAAETRSVFVDRRGALWMHVKNGLCRFRGGRIDRFDKERGLADNEVFGVMEDREGGLWAGTRRGLTQIQEPRALTYALEEGLDCQLARSVFEDDRGTVWISGNDCGVRAWRDGRFSAPISFLDEHAGGFLQETDGTLWMGSILSFLSGGVWTRLQVPEEFGIRDVRALIRDRGGVLWAGTGDGLFIIEADRVERLDVRDGLAHATVYALHETQDGRLWIATANGVTIHDKETFRVLDEPGSPADTKIMSIYEDVDGVLWLGTYAGLYRRGPEGWHRFTSAEGFPGSEILGVLEDDHGYLWMSFLAGVFSVEKRALTELARGRRESVFPLVLDAADGMKNAECNGGFQPSCWKARDGRLWFPTMQGVVVVDPAAIRASSVPPAVHLKQILLDGVAADGRFPLRVRPDVKRIEIVFTAIHFTKPEGLRFRYRLWGFDDRWIDVSGKENRTALFMNLPGGKYRFQLQAGADEDAWNADGAGFEILKARAFHETLLFKALVLAAALAVFQLLRLLVKKYFFLFAFWKKKTYLGQYALMKLIGEGATSSVFMARGFLKKNEIVAVKVLKKECGANPALLKRFKYEAATIDSLDHPHIVKVLERGMHEDSHYIVMEYLPGKTLSDLLDEIQKLPLGAFLGIMIPLSDVLASLHAKGIIHRDLKPSNIMLVEGAGGSGGSHGAPFVKLLDFGLARTFYHTQMTESGSLVGTIPYIPPEQISRSEFLPAGDVYALGVIAYEALTGSVPFQACGEFEILQRKLRETPPSPVTLRPDIPSSVDRLVRRMIAIDPAARPTAADLTAEWRRIAGEFVHPSD